MAWYKNHTSDKVLWLDNQTSAIGEMIFTFDGETTFNLFQDYPWKLTKEQKEIFDKENPRWAEYFKDRS